MQVYKQTTKINGAESAYRYTYDANGNITSVNDGTYTTTYVYDSANQLLRENNQKAGKTWGWTYDDGGNIRTKTEYAYTEGALGTALDTITYGYSASSWGDLLISHDGNTIVSDANGNMLSYGDEKTFTWKHGRELSGMTDDSGNWTFEYNADGLRVYRSNGTTEYKYYYNGDKLTRMLVNGEDITFGYDAGGAPQYVIYGDHRYVYLTNLQGDVTSIITVGGTTVVEYTYDAWGNILTVTGSMANTLGKENPLRYRGYVYDEEIGLYYLQSRYYDPALGRFINADVYASTGQGLLGNNMFIYCNNNPVLHEDESGKFCLPSFWNNTQNQIETIINSFETIKNQNVAFSYGEYISFTLGSFNVSGTIETAFDTKGNIQRNSSFSFDVTTSGSMSASYGKTASIFFVPDTSFLAGDTTYFGGGASMPVASLPIAISGSANVGQTSDGYMGFLFSAGVTPATPAGGELHGGYSYTHSWTPQINIFDIFNIGG